MSRPEQLQPLHFYKTRADQSPWQCLHIHQLPQVGAHPLQAVGTGYTEKCIRWLHLTSYHSPVIKIWKDFREALGFDSYFSTSLHGIVPMHQSSIQVLIPAPSSLQFCKKQLPRSPSSPQAGTEDSWTASAALPVPSLHYTCHLSTFHHLPFQEKWVKPTQDNSHLLLHRSLVAVSVALDLHSISPRKLLWVWVLPVEWSFLHV